VFVIYFYTQYLITISNSLSHITIKPKAKHGFPLATTVFFHILWGQQGIKKVDKFFRYNCPTRFRAVHQEVLPEQPNHKCWQPLAYSQKFSRNYAKWVKSFYKELQSCLPLNNTGKKGITVLGHSSCTLRRIGMGGTAFPNCGSQYLKEPEDCIPTPGKRTC